MFGSTMNWSLTENDGKYAVGMHYKDSSGINIEHNCEDDSLTGLIDSVFKNFKTDYAKQSKALAAKAKREAEKKSELENEDKPANKTEAEIIKELKETIKTLQNDNNNLRVSNKILQRRADDAVNEKLNKKSNAPLKVEDPFEDFLSMFDKFFY